MSAIIIPPYRQNVRVGMMAASFGAAMLGVAFAAVPLYRLFCQATGFGGTPARALQDSSSVIGKTVRVRFDANIDFGLPWRFLPVQGIETPKIGANTLAYFTAENLSDQPITGQALFNISPESAAKYFTKVQCFCFTEQTLRAHEKVTMPVSYYIDPKIMDDVQARDVPEITLSYTFFRVETPPVSVR
jgi:cytochrome c oxidase assembly protein subunit 11